MAYTTVKASRMRMKDMDEMDDKKRMKKKPSKRGVPPLIRGKEAKTNAGFQENISRERDLGKSMKRAVGTAYGEADLAKRKQRKMKKDR